MNGVRSWKSGKAKLSALLLCAAFLFAVSACAPAVSAAETPAPSEQPAPAAAVAAAPSPSPSRAPTTDPAMEPVTLVWLSDTQGYASSFPDTLLAMTQWIVDNKEKLNIQYVLQTGDIVNDMLRDSEWTAATNAFDVLAGQVPIIAIAGNHDIKGVVHDYSRFSELMARQNFESYPTFGGMEANGRRRFDLITIGHEDYILIGVGYSVQQSDVNWLNSTLAQYSDRTAILLAHWYLELGSNALEADSQTLHDVVAANPNVRYVLCGHRHGLKHVEETYDDNGDGTAERTVQAIMVDYQALPNGGDGYLMLLTFDPTARTVGITSYSPLLDDYNYFDDESLETYTMPLSTVSGG